jgi:hypothetical protein
MFDLQPPRHISTLRISPIAAHSGEGRFIFRFADLRSSCRPTPEFTTYALARRLRASWVEGEVMQQRHLCPSQLQLATRCSGHQPRSVRATGSVGVSCQGLVRPPRRGEVLRACRSLWIGDRDASVDPCVCRRPSVGGCIDSGGPRFRPTRHRSSTAPRHRSSWFPRAADGGWHRVHWQNRWGYWHWGHCVLNGPAHHWRVRQVRPPLR